MSNNTFLITGATGTIGRQVIHELLRTGNKVRVLTRNHSKVNLPTSVEVFEGDLNHPESIKKALIGIKGIHLISFGDENYTPLSGGKKIVEMAEETGVERSTVLWNGEGNESTIEQAVKQSNLDWTILQPQEYMANALGWADSIITKNEVKEPFGDRPTAAIHENDVGSVIAAILTQGNHTKKNHTLTGPNVLTPKKQVQEIGYALGQEVKFIELDEKQTRARWKEWGLPKETMDYLYEWYGNTPAQGYTITPVVESILGRSPKTFKDWVSENIGNFKHL